MQESDVQRINTALAEYSATYFGNRVLCLSEKFDLVESWRENTTFTGAIEKGCYFIFDEAETLLYVGKASMGNSIGARVVSHMGWDGTKLSLVKGLPTHTPRYLRTVSLACPWEAPSLEEFLICKLHPPVNKAGRIFD